MCQVNQHPQGKLAYFSSGPPDKLLLTKIRQGARGDCPVFATTKSTPVRFNPRNPPEYARVQVQNCGFGKLTPLTPKFLRSGILPEACEVDAVHAVRGSVDTKWLSWIMRLISTKAASKHSHRLYFWRRVYDKK
ncbi:uncharacterized protein [Physcomitrium patens]|uniref:uncharacterized protein n=1 Tax=Physcomitrium patens TaxID=3218 RepID=UPI003CCCDD62